MCRSGKKLLRKQILTGINFHGTNFRKRALDRENHENFCLAKISHYTVSTTLNLLLIQSVHVLC